MKTKVPGRILVAAAVVALPLFATAPLQAAPLNKISSAGDQAVSPAPLSSEPTHFTKAIDDLPLMPGLELVEDEDVLFDAPGSGRIAETNAIGPVDVDDVYKFYRRSLPHLGWRVLDPHTYQRETEQLRIDARANHKITVVKFTVKPIASGK